MPNSSLGHLVLPPIKYAQGHARIEKITRDEELA